MTEEEALAWGLEHWNCLAETGSALKLTFTRSRYWSAACAACQFYDEQYGANTGLFRCGENCIVRWEGGSCMRGESEFGDWNWAETVEERKRCALVIAELFEQALDRLP